MPETAQPVTQRVLMVRHELEDIPRFLLPEGFFFRWYQPGDELHWLNIHLAAEHHEPVTAELFLRRFGSDSGILAQRQLFLFAPDGQAAGTATAWYDASFQGQNYGRVHYVAVLPAYQGRGLAKPLMTAILLRLKELHHERAYLATSTTRVPAIALYLAFGFEPLIRNTGEATLWQGIMSKLRNPRPAPPACSPGDT